MIDYEVSNVFVIELQEIDVGIKKRSQTTAFAHLIALPPMEIHRGQQCPEPGGCVAVKFRSINVFELETVQAVSCEDAEGII
ncbi:MAG: hypothetical protein AAAC48_09895 [Phyllobacterium sp.]|uniref:hypothetical protein n=1 Tax=Phyllobacterium sp. TaxID=1871046 RepID=UPI0030F03A6D